MWRVASRPPRGAFSLAFLGGEMLPAASGRAGFKEPSVGLTAGLNLGPPELGVLLVSLVALPLCQALSQLARGAGSDNSEPLLFWGNVASLGEVLRY